MNSVGAISADIHRLSQSILQESEASRNPSEANNQPELRIDLPKADDDPETPEHSNDVMTGVNASNTNKSELKAESKPTRTDNLDRVDVRMMRESKQSISENVNVSFVKHREPQFKHTVICPRVINMEIKNSSELSVRSVRPTEDLKLPEVLSPRNGRKSKNGSSGNNFVFQYRNPYLRGLGTVMPDIKDKESKPKPVTKQPICAFRFPEPESISSIVRPVQLHQSNAFNPNDLRRKRSNNSRNSRRIELSGDEDPSQNGFVVKIPTAYDRCAVHLPKIQVTKAAQLHLSQNRENLRHLFNTPLNSTWPRSSDDEMEIETYHLSPSLTNRSNRVISRSTSSPADVEDPTPASPIAPPRKRVLKRKDTVILPKINPAPPPTREYNSPCFHRHYLTPSPRPDVLPRIAVSTPTEHLSKGVSFLYPQLFP